MQVGLSGSSAIIVAAFRGLLEFHGLSLEDLHISQNGDFATIFWHHNLKRSSYARAQISHKLYWTLSE